ncbi:MAG: putative DNA binding domain-containing protein [Colwellia sp.]|nr:putative DNA binding domain-containing protein [Colwellia sp.]
MPDSTLNNTSDIALLQENSEVECKLAGGKDGNGAVPNDMWESYSAFANTRGGEILLGIREKKGHFIVEGIKNPAPLIKSIWDIVNNPQKINHNLLSENNVKIERIDGKSVIRIKVPRASRELRPIYINNNPLSGTYVRRYEADQKCWPDIVNRMLAEREDVRDNRILEGFGLDDIDPESLRIYRQMFIDAKPQGHPFLEQGTAGFLRSIKAWRKDRKTKQEGLTLAGLVMFGTWDAIQDALPNFFVDYQEKDDSSHRWIDRVFPDGSWSGNIFDFYRKIYRKLTVDLKVGFQLKDGQRINDTPAHEAIREALVNTLAHADYTSDSSLLIEKHPDFIGFRNPGLMRVPVKDAIAGGDSLCRNPAVHQMFLNIGLSEKAGSGVPKIYSNCRAQKWQTPNLYEKDDPEQTLLELRMVNLVSEEMHIKLIELFGDQYKDLSELKRSILITAATESWFNHDRISALTSAHTRDITLALSNLVKADYLTSAGVHKDKIYHIKGVEIPTPDNEAGKNITFISSPDLSQLSLFSESPELELESPELELESPGFSKGNPGIQEKKLWTELFIIAAPIRDGNYRVKRKELETIIIALCNKSGDKYLKLAQLAELLGRNSDTLRKNYLSPMLKSQQLELAFPTKPSHPEQGYKVK